MRKRILAGLLGCTSLALATLAGGHPDDGRGPEDHQHGGNEGHLPASSANVALIGEIRLTNVEGGIADVTAFRNHAYLAAFAPECAGRPGAQGTGVHVVDIRDPNNPAKVGFLPAEANSYVGEGVHVFEFGGRDILVHNNEICRSDRTAIAGVAVWDVTNPLAAVKLDQFGDTSPTVVGRTYHTTHSVQGFAWQNRVYVVAQDNNDFKDIDIFDITGVVTRSGPAVLVWEGGIEDWPQARGSSAWGDALQHHDMQQKVIGGQNFLLLSYWDAGQILLNISNPANPVFVAPSDFPSPDTLTGFQLPTGNSHQSYWSSDNAFILSTDEDFSPTRTHCVLGSGPDAGETACNEFTWTVPLETNFPGGLVGNTIWGGSGCLEDLNGNGVSDRDEVPRAASPSDIVAFARGTCHLSVKVESGQLAGYNAVVFGQWHADTRHGLAPDRLFSDCGFQGHAFTITASAFCIGHRATHLLFDDAPAYTGAEPDDMPPIGTLGAQLSARGPVFDGWGYVRLLDAATLREIGAYAVPEALDPAFASGFGDLTVHEVKTDPRLGVNLAYVSYYAAGLRVLKFGRKGLAEAGHYITEGGNNFWGVYPIQLPPVPYRTPPTGRANGGAPYLLLSDRDHGLWIFRYTGD